MLFQTLSSYSQPMCELFALHGGANFWSYLYCSMAFYHYKAITAECLQRCEVTYSIV